MEKQSNNATSNISEQDDVSKTIKEREEKHNYECFIRTLARLVQKYGWIVLKEIEAEEGAKNEEKEQSSDV